MCLKLFLTDVAPSKAGETGKGRSPRQDIEKTSTALPQSDGLALRDKARSSVSAAAEDGRKHLDSAENQSPSSVVHHNAFRKTVIAAFKHLVH